MRGLLAVILVATACGGGDSSAPPDAPGELDGGPSDAPMYPACREFSGAALGVPAHVTGTLGAAEVMSPTACAVVDAPYGVESAGPDRVIPLRGLTVGMPYVVRVVSASDLAFYVVTGCSTPSGPAADQCLLFQDGSTGAREVGRFVAESSTAYVVVDFFASSPPPSLEFTLDVYAEQCDGTGAAEACSAPTPACFEGRCVACVTSFDCVDPARPVCGADHMCRAGVDQCASDGEAEPGDDGPAGAPLLQLDELGHTTILGQICSKPRTEADFAAFEVTSLGETWDITLQWPAGRDLDLRIHDATGTELGLSFWERPERVRLTQLPLGRYYIQVREFASTPDPSPVTYTLSVRRTPGAACTSAADCAVEYRNQIFRGHCDAGACVALDGDASVTEGGRCDSMSDCAPDLACPSFYFVADADTRQTCARGCGGDSDCAALGPDYVCTTYLPSNFCVAKCTEDDHCPTALSTQPASGPWVRLSCEPTTGRCVP